MNKIIQKAIFSLIITLPLNNSIFANSIFMGNMDSVVSNGSFDVIKNPALLSLQTSKNSMGIIVSYMPLMIQSNSCEIGFPGVNNASLSLENSTIISGSILLSYSRKIKRGVLGFAISSGQPNLIDYGQEMASIHLPAPYNIDLNTDKKTLSILPAITSAYSYKINKLLSVGANLKFSYNYQRITDHQEESVNSALDNTQDKKLDYDEIDFKFSTGLFIKSKIVQAGILIKSGNLKWRKEYFELSAEQITPSGTWFDSKTNNFNFSANKNFSITLGSSFKLGKTVLIAIEYAHFLPFTKNSSDIKFNNPTKTFTFTTTEQLFLPGNLYKVGLKISFKNSFSLSTGGGITTLGIRQSGSDGEKANIDIIVPYYTLGLDYTVSKNIKIYAGTNISFSFTTFDLTAKGMTMDVNAFDTKFSFLTGCSYNF